jgi:hypothetical protein
MAWFSAAVHCSDTVERNQIDDVADSVYWSRKQLVTGGWQLIDRDEIASLCSMNVWSLICQFTPDITETVKTT